MHRNTKIVLAVLIVADIAYSMKGTAILRRLQKRNRILTLERDLARAVADDLSRLDVDPEKLDIIRTEAAFAEILINQKY